MTQRTDLGGEISRDIEVPSLSRGGVFAAGGILGTAVLLLVASGLEWQLGLPTFLAGLATAVVILILNRLSSWEIARDISWSVLPLVAGLFVLVEAVKQTGLLKPLIASLPASARAAPDATGFALGPAVAVLCNIVNNLPLGLVAGTLANGAHLAPHVTGALLAVAPAGAASLMQIRRVAVDQFPASVVIVGQERVGAAVHQLYRVCALEPLQRPLIPVDPDVAQRRPLALHDCPAAEVGLDVRVMRRHQRDNWLTQARGRLRSEIRSYRRRIPILIKMDQQPGRGYLHCQAIDQKRGGQKA